MKLRNEEIKIIEQRKRDKATEKTLDVNDENSGSDDKR